MADNHFKVRRGVHLEPQTSAPSNPQNGDLYYDSTLQKFRKYENNAWSDIGATSGSGFDANTILTNASGDVLVNSDGNVLLTGSG